VTPGRCRCAARRLTSARCPRSGGGVHVVVVVIVVAGYCCCGCCRHRRPSFGRGAGRTRNRDGRLPAAQQNRPDSGDEAAAGKRSQGGLHFRWEKCRGDVIGETPRRISRGFAVFKFGLWRARRLRNPAQLLVLEGGHPPGLLLVSAAGHAERGRSNGHHPHSAGDGQTAEGRHRGHVAFGERWLCHGGARSFRRTAD